MGQTSRAVTVIEGIQVIGVTRNDPEGYPSRDVLSRPGEEAGEPEKSSESGKR